MFEGFNLHAAPVEQKGIWDIAMIRNPFKNKCVRDFARMRRNLMPSIESFNGETSIAHTLISDGKCLTSKKDRLVLEDCDTPKSERNRVRRYGVN